MVPASLSAWQNGGRQYGEHADFRGTFDPRLVLGHHDGIGLNDGEIGDKKAGMLPYAALFVGALLVQWAIWYFQFPTA